MLLALAPTTKIERMQIKLIAGAIFTVLSIQGLAQPYTNTALPIALVATGKPVIVCLSMAWTIQKIKIGTKKS